MPLDYESYLLAEWNMFLGDPTRARATLDATAGQPVERVLDVGCGAGQELIPFAQRGSFCVGVDSSPLVGSAPWSPEHGRVSFLRGTGERLPFRDESFDVLICRGALQTMNIPSALAEMARVLRPRGLLLLHVLAAPFYLRTLRRGLSRLDARSCAHAINALVSGTVYHVLGAQVRTPFTPATYQSEWMVRRELRRVKMRIVGRLPYSNRRAPCFAIRKTSAL
jgi:ubiquinone/menaquinone biosynthesis C-methylase UbiE